MITRILLLTSFLFLMFSNISYGQSKEEIIYKKGETYHVLIKDKLVYTKDIYSLLDKIDGKTKLIVENEKAEPRDYKISKKAQKYLEDFSYLKITTAIPWRLALCRCWAGTHYITLGCQRARGDKSKCADCCKSMEETLPWDVLITME